MLQHQAKLMPLVPQAGMTSINDFATTYMCQSLPFGGVKHSGFDRFAGIEGLRGLTVPKAVAEDRWDIWAKKIGFKSNFRNEKRRRPLRRHRGPAWPHGAESSRGYRWDIVTWENTGI